MVDHKFYIKWAIEDLEKAIERLKTSHEQTHNPLMGGVIHGLEQHLGLLKSQNQLF